MTRVSLTWKIYCFSRRFVLNLLSIGGSALKLERQADTWSLIAKINESGRSVANSWQFRFGHELT